MAWGTSVLISASVAGLAERADVDVVQVEATLAAARCAVRGRRTHAVVCDLATVPAAEVLALLASHPHLRVVVVLPDAARGIALTCERVPLRTIADLASAVTGGAADGDVAGTTSGPGRTQGAPDPASGTASKRSAARGATEGPAAGRTRTLRSLRWPGRRAP